MSYQNILCVTDFSKYANAAYLRGTEIAKLYNAKLTLLHVVEYFPEDRSNIQIAPENVDPKEYREEQALSLMSEQIQSSKYNNVNKVVLFSTHSAKQEIIHYAKEQKNDLIIVASHGHHGIGAILGSTANAISQSSLCDVLIIHANSL